MYWFVGRFVTDCQSAPLQGWPCTSWWLGLHCTPLYTTVHVYTTVHDWTVLYTGPGRLHTDTLWAVLC